MTLKKDEAPVTATTYVAAVAAAATTTTMVAPAAGALCLDRSFYQRPTHVVAKELVGKRLVRRIAAAEKEGGGAGGVCRLAGIIVETEAYGHDDDEASHAYAGPTTRNWMMFGQVGRAYVYFTYGNHFCVNVSARSSSKRAGAVLIRAIEPVEGVETMKKLRGLEDLKALASGPGKLTQSLGITSGLNGVDMTDPRSELYIEKEGPPSSSRPAAAAAMVVTATPRIGITKAAGKRWRFVDSGSQFLSRRISGTAKASQSRL